MQSHQRCIRQRRPGISFYLVGIFFLLVPFTATPVLGQTNYADSWLWSPNAPYEGDNIDNGEDNVNPVVYVLGSGVTDGSYGATYHDYTLSITLRSPAGRTSSTSAYGYNYASANVSLLFDLQDVGTYVTSFYTTGYCANPYNPSYHGIGGGGAGLPAGVSFTCFQYVRTIREFVDANGVPKRTVLYQLVTPCDASCKANTATYTFPWAYSGSPYLASAEPYVGVPPYNICSHLAALTQSPSCTGCVDVDLP